MPRPIHAVINTEALRHNFSLARRHAGASTRLWCVIKANAYGHGLLRVAQALCNNADGFALLDLQEAIALREAGIRQPILMLEGFFSPDDLTLFAEYALTPVVHSREQLEILAAASLPTRLPVYLKINTGMNRLGFEVGEAKEALVALAAIPHAGGVTLMSHFADADNERGINAQLEQFAMVREGYDKLPSSLANSATLLRFPQACGDWARPGIMLYGASPMPQIQSAQKLGLQPVMSLNSEIIAVRNVQKGERIGYGGLFEAKEAMRTGIVACGYADGYPRGAPSGTPILIDGQRTRTLGQVSMDMLAVDLTPLARAGVGSPVVLWGEGLPVDDVATSAGTVSYELLCALAPRVPVTEVL